MHVAGVALTTTQVMVLADALERNRFYGLAGQLRKADSAGVHDLELTVDERDAVMRALDQGPAELADFRSVLLDRRAGRKR